MKKIIIFLKKGVDKSKLPSYNDFKIRNEKHHIILIFNTSQIFIGKLPTPICPCKEHTTQLYYLKAAYLNWADTPLHYSIPQL